MQIVLRLAALSFVDWISGLDEPFGHKMFVRDIAHRLLGQTRAGRVGGNRSAK